jgi:hypothetical protein
MTSLRGCNNALPKIIKILSICLLIFCFLIPNFSIKAQSDIIYSIALNNNQSLGQSLTTIYRGFNNFGFFLLTEKPTEGSLELKIFKNALDKELVFQQKYPIHSSKTEYISLSFPALTDSDLQDYYLELSWEGAEPLHFLTRGPMTYDQGSLYFEDEPVQAQLDRLRSRATDIRLIQNHTIMDLAADTDWIASDPSRLGCVFRHLEAMEFL